MQQHLQVALLSVTGLVGTLFLGSTVLAQEWHLERATVKKEEFCQAISSDGLMLQMRSADIFIVRSSKIRKEVADGQHRGFLYFDNGTSFATTISAIPSIDDNPPLVSLAIYRRPDIIDAIKDSNYLSLGFYDQASQSVQSPEIGKPILHHSLAGSYQAVNSLISCIASIIDESSSEFIRAPSTSTDYAVDATSTERFDLWDCPQSDVIYFDPSSKDDYKIDSMAIDVDIPVEITLFGVLRQGGRSADSLPLAAGFNYFEHAFPSFGWTFFEPGDPNLRKRIANADIYTSANAPVLAESGVQSVDQNTSYRNRNIDYINEMHAIACDSNSLDAGSTLDLFAKADRELQRLLDRSDAGFLRFPRRIRGTYTLGTSPTTHCPISIEAYDIVGFFEGEGSCRMLEGNSEQWNGEGVFHCNSEGYEWTSRGVMSRVGDRLVFSLDKPEGGGNIWTMILTPC